MAYPAKLENERRFVCNILNQNPFIVCPETGFIKADHLGTGMLFLSKSMILKMVGIHMQDGKWYRDHVTQNPVARLFEVATGPDNTLWSEDYVFCQKWKNIGGELWVYKDAWVKHYGGKTWLDSIGNIT